MNTNRTILVIDEEAYLLRNFLRTAESAGYQITGTAVIEEGFHLAKKLKPDVILVNTIPPDGDGIELCKQVKAEPVLSETYIMMLSTGKDELDAHPRKPEIDVDDYVPKPISSRELLARIQAMLRVKNVETQLSNALQELRRKNDLLLTTQKQLQELQQKDDTSLSGIHEQLDAFPPSHEELYNALPVGYCAIDKYGLIAEANLRAARLLGVKRSVLVDTLFPDYIVEDDVGRFFLHLAKVFETQKRQRCEVRIVQQDGSPRYVLLESIVVRQRKEILEQCGTTITDITQYKRARKQARETGKFYRKILNNFADVVFITDDFGAFTFISPSVRSIWGYSDEEVQRLGNIETLLGRRPFKPVDLQERQEIPNIECEITDKSGARHVLLITVYRVAMQAGTVLYSCRDITDYKEQRQEYLPQAHHVFQDTEETPPDIMYIYDLEEERTIYPVHQVPTFLGYDPQKIQELGPMAFESLLHPSDLTRLELFRQQWEMGAADEEVLNLEYRLKAAHGEWRWFRVQEKVLLRDVDEAVKQILGRAWDITGQKFKEEDFQEIIIPLKTEPRQIQQKPVRKPARKPKNRRVTSKRR